MFENFIAVPLHFTIELVGFLVTAGATVLVYSRPELIPGGKAGRGMVCVGFLVLAAVQVIHGGSFVEADGHQGLALVRAAAFVLILLGLMGTRPVQVGAATALDVRQPALFAPAGAALLLSFVALRQAGSRQTPALRKLAGAAFMLAVAEALTAIQPQARFGSGEIQVYAYAAHGLKLAGFIFLGSWLWYGARTSIRIRYIVSFAALLVAVVLALSSALTGVISNNVAEAELRRVEVLLGNALRDIEDQEGSLADNANIVSKLPEVANATQASIRNLPSQLFNNPANRDLLNADFVVIDPVGAPVAAAGDGPANDTQRRERPSLSSRLVLAISGSETSRAVAGRDAELGDLAESPERVRGSIAILAAARLRIAGGPVILIMGRWLDGFTARAISRDFQPARASIVIGDQAVASTLRPAALEEDIVPEDVETDISLGGRSTKRQTLAGRSFFSAFASITRADGVPVATLVLSTPSSVVVDAREGVTRTLFLVALGVGAIALALASISGGRITRPIQQLTRSAVAVREGDLTVQAEVGGRDEVGQLGETFNEMTASLLQMTGDLREAAREEARLRSRIETIIESMADGLVAVGGDKRILAFNREAEILTGIAAADAIGKPVQEVLEVREPHGDAVELPIVSLSAGSVGGVLLTRANDEPVPVAVTSAVLVTEEDEVAGAVAVIRDMTREREIERMKSEFLSNISHELRTPLTPIKGYAEILSRKELPAEKTRQFATGIVESTARLERIVELLVDFSAMEAGRMAHKTAPVEIGALVKDLAQEWEKRAPRHQVVADVKARLPKVEGDERLLRRSFDEVIDNAIKFSPEGGTIRLEARGATVAGNGRGRGVAVTISDEGIGISAEDLPRIFSDFQQLDGSATRSYGGLGLGLAYVRRIIEAHEGVVDVQSEPEQGTKLTITLPAVRSRGGR